MLKHLGLPNPKTCLKPPPANIPSSKEGSQVNGERMSKLSGETLREGIAGILEGSQQKPRKFTETIELQVRTISKVLCAYLVQQIVRLC